ncbi:hypothetical protein [Pedobacter punctiformis]|uniref:Tail fiber protein n=1 Tax=Pedobacter punctiformis TaxID=3004097 RepID=A0ABT4LAN6_9SPHI|nr:hypothetical protein [Pedobacter sp. HCMS5-2]MCZ4244986.1 hypothetical protein [Pedobacter sp. HCMS5-2]
MAKKIYIRTPKTSDTIQDDDLKVLSVFELPVINEDNEADQREGSVGIKDGIPVYHNGSELVPFGSALTFGNGLTESGGVAKLGGSLTEPYTIIDTTGNFFIMGNLSGAPGQVYPFLVLSDVGQGAIFGVQDSASSILSNIAFKNPNDPDLPTIVLTDGINRLGAFYASDTYDSDLDTWIPSLKKVKALIPAPSDLTPYQQRSEKGTANGYASLGADGKVPNSQIPALAISETFPVNSQAAMLALSTAGQGDVAVRTDISKSFILTQSPASTLANWQELLTPTDAVSSVNGQVGNVSLTTTEISEGSNKYYLDSRVDARITGKANLVGGNSFTGAQVLTGGSSYVQLTDDSGNQTIITGSALSTRTPAGVGTGVKADGLEHIGSGANNFKLYFPASFGNRTQTLQDKDGSVALIEDFASGQIIGADTTGKATGTTLQDVTTAGNVSVYELLFPSWKLPFKSINPNSRTWNLANDIASYGDFAISQSTTQSLSGFVQRLYFDPTGNIGIGTTSPSEKLEVNGNIKADNLGSGVYTPTFTAGANTTSAGGTDAHFMRLGNQVTVYGTVQATLTSGGSNSSVTISLPIASTLTNANDVVGHGSVGYAGYNPGVVVTGDVANARAVLVINAFSSAGNGITVNVPYSFTYTIK